MDKLNFTNFNGSKKYCVEDDLNNVIRKLGPSSIKFNRGDLINLCKGLMQSDCEQTLPQGIKPLYAIYGNKNSYQLPDYNMKGEVPVKKEVLIEKIIKMNSTNKKISTLIIDDDIDSLIPVDSIFRKYGCKVEQAMNFLDASRKIKDFQTDLIILDWNLGDLSGGKLIEQCSIAIAADEYLSNKFKLNPVKIITYSGQDSSTIHFTGNISPYFKHVGHWSKKEMYSAIEEKAVRAMTK